MGDLVGNPGLRFRRATAEDLDPIVRMLADDPLGATRETHATPLPASYLSAFAAIQADPHNELWVACLDDQVVGVLQVTFIPSLSYRGRWRALVEGVRVDSGVRRRGVGRALLERAIARARERGCHLVQLTTDKSRPEAKAFYESLGFAASHEGMKLRL